MALPNKEELPCAGSPVGTSRSLIAIRIPLVKRILDPELELQPIQAHRHSRASGLRNCFNKSWTWA